MYAPIARDISEILKKVFKRSVLWYDKRVLEILGLNGQLQEWFEYGGKPYHFKISIDMNNKAFDETTEKSLTDLIDANKNVRSKLEVLIINLISSVTQKYTSCAITSEEITV